MHGREQVRLESRIWADAFALGEVVARGEGLGRADLLELYEDQQLFLAQFDKNRPVSPGRLTDEEMLILSKMRIVEPTARDRLFAEL